MVTWILKIRRAVGCEMLAMSLTDLLPYWSLVYLRVPFAAGGVLRLYPVVPGLLPIVSFATNATDHQRHWFLA